MDLLPIDLVAMIRTTFCLILVWFLTFDRLRICGQTYEKCHVSINVARWFIGGGIKFILHHFQFTSLHSENFYQAKVSQKNSSHFPYHWQCFIGSLFYRRHKNHKNKSQRETFLPDPITNLVYVSYEALPRNPIVCCAISCGFISFMTKTKGRKRIRCRQMIEDAH